MVFVFFKLCYRKNFNEKDLRTMAVKLSFVIPVYNGAESIMRVVDDIESRFRSIEIEIILVNDGSKDRSEEVCRELANRKHVVFLQLAKNFG